MPYLTTRKNLKLQLSPGLVASYDISQETEWVYSGTQHTPRTHMGGGGGEGGEGKGREEEQHSFHGSRLIRSCRKAAATEN